MAEVTRDMLAEVLEEARREAGAWGEVRVELATLNGNLETLGTELRMGLKALAEGRADDQREIAELRQRVTVVERWQWRVGGAFALLGVLAGIPLGAYVWA